MRALGVDYGRKRIGLALSDPTGLLARPWKSLVARGSVPFAAESLAREAEALAAEADGLHVIVLGLPRRLSGEPGDQTPAVESLALRLRRLVHVPVALQDERLSSREADYLLSRREKDWRKRKPKLDAMAAAVILQDYLDVHPAPARGASGASTASPGPAEGDTEETDR